jgi:hypothetical protein
MRPPPPPLGLNGIMGLGENLEIIYELQSVTGKILKRQGFKVSRFLSFKVSRFQKDLA